MKAEELPCLTPGCWAFQVDSFGEVIMSQRALGEYSASDTKVLRVHLFILYFMSKALILRKE